MATKNKVSGWKPSPIRDAPPMRDTIEKDPGFVLKEKIAAAEAAAAAAEAARNAKKDDLHEPGMILKEKILASQQPPRTTKSTYKLRQHRTTAVAASSQAPSAPRTTAVAASSPVPSAPPVEEMKDESSELTRQQQDEEDLFGEDHERPGVRARRRYTPQLTVEEMEARNVEQLESYAVLKSQDVSENIRDCVRVAEETTGIASAAMETLHDQGIQIKRAHMTAVRAEEDLKTGEKLLGSLGGFFRRRWKPKKTPKIKGPQVAPDAFKKKNIMLARAELYSRDTLDDDEENKARARARKFEGLSATQVQLEMEREHQDDALEGLGDIVSKLKNMTGDMNEEVEKQTAAMGTFSEDVEVIRDRVGQSYQRTRYIVGG